MFDSTMLSALGLDPTTLYPSLIPRPPSRSTEDKQVRTMEDEPPPSLLSRIFDALFRRKRPAEEFVEPDIPCGASSEEDEELGDALSPIYDQLRIRKIWWVLEIIPMGFRHQQGNDKWVSWFGYVSLESTEFIQISDAVVFLYRPNLARARLIPTRMDRVKVHRSVKMRMEASAREEYHPRAILPAHDEVIWVD